MYLLYLPRGEKRSLLRHYTFSIHMCVLDAHVSGMGSDSADGDEN